MTASTIQPFKPRVSTVQRSRLSKFQQQVFNLKDPNIFLDITEFTQIDKTYLNQLFGNSNPIILDLGFGDGDQLFELAINLPQYNFIGIELYRKGIANIISKIKSHIINNVKVIYGDATQIIPKFQDNTFYKVQVFFPDPWPKLRHHKRRLLQYSFIQLTRNKLFSSGVLHIVTDSENYADNIYKIIKNIPEFKEIKDYAMFRPVTKFEKIAKTKGNSTYELIFILQSI